MVEFGNGVLSLCSLISIRCYWGDVRKGRDFQSEMYIYWWMDTEYDCFWTGEEQGHIRASVDALCRDGTDEISRDPRIKRY